MKKTTFTNDKLLKYGALSAAILGGTATQAQIAPSAVGFTGDTYDSSVTGAYAQDGSAWGTTYLGLETAGGEVLPEILIQTLSRNVDFTYVQSRTFNGYSAVVGVSAAGYNYPSALAFGDEIDAMSTFLEDPMAEAGSANGATLNFNDGQFSGDQWTSANTNYEMRYLGFKIIAGMDTHYGWIKMAIQADGHISVESVALNLTVAESLTAGEGEDQLSILDANHKNIKITALDNEINISNTPKNINYNLYSVTGQRMLSGKVTENTHSIFTNTLTKGIYIVELTNEKSQSVLRKKVLIK